MPDAHDRQGEVDAFAALSGDDNRLHTDGAYARSSGFRGRGRQECPVRPD